MSNKKGLLALSPLFLLIVLIVAFTVYSVDASHKDTNLSLTVAFMISSIYAIAISGGMPIKSRVDTYSKVWRQQSDAHAVDICIGRFLRSFG